jgi:hypothetical protein
MQAIETLRRNNRRPLGVQSGAIDARNTCQTRPLI